ncbi:hypothetical protein [Mesorhizobium sp. BR-1-1-10]|uniref:hypothetical protein n=1 Tax=Mesorhizobium sp. BR-1-1-10 TaxID=2876660 RepID=UPI001CD07CA8|nr:hypothetical protein [Mesorhizobium sp. BR-1-1-10]MBZ9979193.1 hypothetical protein [Mesorhizobium sp. BR-1-1-10]
MRNSSNFRGISYLALVEDDLGKSTPDSDQVESSSKSGNSTPILNWHSSLAPTVNLRCFVTDPSSQPPDDDAMKFLSLYSAIDEMHSFPLGFPERIDEETAIDAERVLSFIDVSGIDAPTIFSHGGDAVVFSWDLAKINRYLTISGGDAAFLDVNKQNKMQCPYQIVPLDGPEISTWLRRLGAPSKAASNVE